MTYVDIVLLLFTGQNTNMLWSALVVASPDISLAANLLSEYHARLCTTPRWLAICAPLPGTRMFGTNYGWDHDQIWVCRILTNLMTVVHPVIHKCNELVIISRSVVSIGKLHPFPQCLPVWICLILKLDRWSWTTQNTAALLLCLSVGLADFSHSDPKPIQMAKNLSFWNAFWKKLRVTDLVCAAELEERAFQYFTRWLYAWHARLSMLSERHRTGSQTPADEWGRSSGSQSSGMFWWVCTFQMESWVQYDSICIHLCGAATLVAIFLWGYSPSIHPARSQGMIPPLSPPARFGLCAQATYPSRMYSLSELSALLLHFVDCEIILMSPGGCATFQSQILHALASQLTVLDTSYKNAFWLYGCCADFIVCWSAGTIRYAATQRDCCGRIGLSLWGRNGDTWSRMDWCWWQWRAKDRQVQYTQA